MGKAAKKSLRHYTAKQNAGTHLHPVDRRQAERGAARYKDMSDNIAHGQTVNRNTKATQSNPMLAKPKEQTKMEISEKTEKNIKTYWTNFQELGKDVFSLNYRAIAIPFPKGVFLEIDFSESAKNSFAIEEAAKNLNEISTRINFDLQKYVSDDSETEQVSTCIFYNDNKLYLLKSNDEQEWNANSVKEDFEIIKEDYSCLQPE